MADIKTNQSKVYNALKGMGFSGIGNNEAEFANLMAKPQNREKVYQALSSKGYKGIGKDQAAFDNLIYEAQQPTQQQETATQPASNGSVRSIMRQGLQKGVAKAQQKPVAQPIQPLSYQSFFDLTPQENQQMQKRMQQRKDEIEYEQETGKQLRQPIFDAIGKEISWEAPTVARDDYGNIRHGENGQPLIGTTTDQDIVKEHKRIKEERATQELSLTPEEKLEVDLVEAQEERKRLINEIGKKYQESLVDGNSRGAEDDMNALQAALRQLDDRIKTQTYEKDDAGFWQHLGIELSDLSSWNPFNAVSDASALLNAKSKIDSGQPLSDSDRLLLANTLLSQEAHDKYDQNRGALFRAGGIAAESIKLMPDFVLGMGPMKSIATGVAKGTGKVITKAIGKKAAESVAGKILTKAAGVGLGTLAAGGALVNTVQLPRLASETMGNMAGDLTLDEKGNYKFEGGDNVLNSVLKAEQTLIPEAASEVAGEFLPGVGTALEKIGLKRIAGGLERLQGTKWYKNYSKVLEHTGFHGAPGEAVEEYLGDVYSAVLGDISGIVGDENGKGGWGDLDKHVDILLGTATLGALLHTPSLLNTGRHGAQYFRYRHNANKADKAASDMMGAETWNTFKGAIDNTTNENISDVVNGMLKDPKLATNQKQAILDYAVNLQRQRGHLLAIMAENKEKKDEPGKAADVLNNSYAAGYEANSPEEKQAINQNLATATQNLDALGESFADWVKDESNPPMATLSYMMAHRDVYTDEQIAAASDYYQTKFAAEGMQQAAADKAELEGEQSVKPLYTTVEQVNGKFNVSSFDKDGNLIEQQAFDTEDEAQAYQGEVKMRKQHQDFVDLFNSPKVDGAALKNLEMSLGLEDGAIQSLVASDPMKLSESEWSIVDQAMSVLQQTVYPATEVHTDFNREVGSEAADDAQIDTDMPNEQIIQSVVAPYIEAKDNLNKLFNQNEELAEEVQTYENMGKSEQEIISLISNFRPQEVQTVIDFYNAQARFEGFMNRSQEKIEERVRMERGRRTFKGKINGNPDQQNLVQITDGTNTYTLVNGNITVSSDGRVTGSDSGMLLALDQNGDIVSLGDNSSISVLPTQTTLDQWEQQFREQMQVNATAAIDPEGTLNPQNQPQQEGGTSETEAGGTTNTGEGNQPQSAIERIPKDKTGNPLYEQATPEDTYDALVEQVGENTAKVLAKKQVDTAIKALEKLNKKMEKGDFEGNTIQEQIASSQALQKQIEATQATINYWNQVLAVPNNRMLNAANNAPASGSTNNPPTPPTPPNNEVPEWRNDTPQAARDRGYKIVEGQRIDRQQEKPMPEGMEVEVQYSTKDKVKGRMTVSELDDVQGSHLTNGQINDKHFLPEAQPKAEFGADRQAAAQTNASEENFRPELMLTFNGVQSAYSGSASQTNRRGEVIQGNGRRNLAEYIYAPGNEAVAQKYKTFLKAHAAELGTTPEAIDQMEKPFAHIVLDVTDEEAIRLGQFTAADLETGGRKIPDVTATVTKLGDNYSSFTNILLRHDDPDATLAERVDKNLEETVNWLNRGGYINNTEAKSLLEDKDAARQFLKDMLTDVLFRGANPNVRTSFYELPKNIQNAIVSVIGREVAINPDVSILKDIQESIQAYHTLVAESAEFAAVKGKNNDERYRAADAAVNDWLRQINLDGSVNRDKFSNFALELAKLYASLKDQKTLSTRLRDYYDLVNGTTRELGIFEAPTSGAPMTKEEAIKQVFEIDYGGQRIVPVAGNNQSSQEGGENGSNPTESGEREEGEGESSDTGAGDTGNAPEGGEQQISEREKFIQEHPLTEEEIDASNVPEGQKILAKQYLNLNEQYVSEMAKGAYTIIYNKKVAAQNKPQQTETQPASETKPNAPSTPAAEQPSTPKPETPSTPQNSAQSAAKARMAAALAKLKQHGKKQSDNQTDAYRVENLTPEQLEDMFEVVEAGAELGYTLLDGVQTKEEWIAQMREAIVEPLKDATGYTDADVTEILEDMWGYPYVVEGQAKTVGEWAAEKGINVNENNNEQGNGNGNNQPTELPGSTTVGGSTEVAVESGSNNEGQPGVSGESGVGTVNGGSNSGTQSRGQTSRGGQRTGGTGTTRSKTRGTASTTEPGNLFGEDTGNGANDTPGIEQGGTAATVPESGIVVSENGKEPKKPLADITQEKAPYKPSSIGGKFAIGSVIPSGIADSIANAFKRLKEKFFPKKGSTLDFVREELGYKTNEEMLSDFESGKTDGLAAEQVDAVALAIGKMKDRKSFIVGDMTGVGKGRTAAALIRWGLKHGKKVLFVTEKSGLFSDMHRDLTDIGCDYLPFVTNSDTDANITDADGNKVIPKPMPAAQKALWQSGSDKLPRDKKGRQYDFVMTTYSQVSGNEKGDKKKAEWLREYAKDAIVIMDESHNASGESNTGAYFKEVVENAGGVTFLSATYAKRPDNMLLYALRSSMNAINMPVQSFLEAIKEYGVAMQELMASALFGSGEMIRRERDMSDVKTTWTDPKEVYTEEEYEQCRKTSDKTMSLINDIIQFQRDHVNPIVSNHEKDYDQQNKIAALIGGVQTHASNTAYKSQVSNVTNLMVYAMKAKKAAEMAIEQIKQGKKPVIAVSNTMGSYIDELEGDIPEAGFRPIFEKGVNFSLRYVIADYEKGDDGKYHKVKGSERIFNAEDELTDAGLRALDNLRKRIEEYMGDTDKVDLSLSPIDLVKQMIADAGYNCGEITGRSTQLVKNENGGYTKTSIRQNKKEAARRFNGGSKENPIPENEQYQALILNVAGATGISLHSSKKFGNQQPRTMIILQPNADVNKEVQMRGRIDRTGQVHRGEYFYVSSPIPAEQKITMMLKQKLASLDAQSVGTKKVSSNKVEGQDMDNKYGDEVCYQYLLEHLNDINAFLENGLQWNRKTREWEGRAGLLYDVLKDLQRMPCEMQDKVIAELTQRYADQIDYLNQNGINDLETTTMDLEATTIDKATFVKGKDNESENEFAHDTTIERVEVNVLKKPMRSSDIKKKMKELDALDEDGLPKEGVLQQTTDKVNAMVEKKIADRQQKYDEQEAKLEEKIRSEHPKKEEQTDEEYEDMIKNWPSLAELRNKNKADIAQYQADLASQYNNVYKAAMYLRPGRPYLVPLTDDVGDDAAMMYGRFIGFQLKNGDPRQVQAVFAVKDSRAMITIPVVNKSKVIEKIINDRNDMDIVDLEMDKNTYEQLPAEQRAKNWDEWWDRMIPKNTNRQIRYMITGNVLQACGSLGKYKGQIVTFTRKNKETGEITLERGMLLAENFDPENFKVRRAVEKKDIWDSYNELKDERSGISCHRDGNSMVVKFEKRKGEKLSEHPAQKDDVLKGLAMNGEIRPSGKSAILCVIKEDNVEKALEHLYKEYGYTKEELFVMPDSTEKPDAIVRSNRPYQEVIDELSPKYGNNRYTVERKIRDMLKRYKMDVNNEGLKNDIREAVQLRQAYLRRDYANRESNRLAWEVLILDEKIERYKEDKDYREDAMRKREAILEELEYRGFKGKAYHYTQGKITLDQVRDMFDQMNDAKTEEGKAKKALFEKVMEKVSKLPMEIFMNEKIDNDTGGFAGGRIVNYNWKYMNADYIADQAKADTILHELIHTVTAYADRCVEEGHDHLLDAEMVDAINELHRILDVIKHDPTFVHDGQPGYGLTNVREMLSEAGSNSEFRADLKKTNLWQKVWSGILKFFGIKSNPGTGAKQMNAFDLVMERLDYLIDNFKQEAWEEYYKGSQYGGYGYKKMDAQKIDTNDPMEAIEKAASDYMSSKGYANNIKFIEQQTDKDKAKTRKALENAEATPAKENAITKHDDVSARNAAMEWATENIPEPVTVNTEIGDLIINKKSISDSLAHGFSQAKLDAIPTLVPAFKNGRAVYIGSSNDINGNPVIDHYFAYPIEYKGNREYVFCRTREDANTHRLYIHEVIFGEDIKNGQTLQSTARKEPRTGLPLYRKIMSDIFGSKDTNKNNTKQENKDKKSKINNSNPLDAIQNAANSWRQERRDKENGDNTPLHHSAKAVYNDRLNRVETVFTEAYQDAMVSLKTAQNAIAKDQDIPDSQNAYMAENLMHGKNKNEQDLYNLKYRDPLIRTINRIMNRTGMNWGDVDRYVYTKSGLERNREFFVRDWLEAQRNRKVNDYAKLNEEEQEIYNRKANAIETRFEDGEIDEEQRDKLLKNAVNESHLEYIDSIENRWDILKTKNYLDLINGDIDYSDYLAGMTAFIKENIDEDYDPSEHDYSGFRAMFGDEDGVYDEAQVIDELMDTEAQIGQEEVDLLWNQINDATRYGLERYREAGMRSDEQIDKVEHMFHFYVPMRGFKDDTGEDMYQYFTGKANSKSYVGGLLKHAKGRGSEANYPISTIFAMSYKAIADCNQNMVNQKFYRLCQANPNDLVVLSDSWAVYDDVEDVWKEVAPDIPDDASEDEVREITKAWEAQMQQLAKEGKAMKLKGKARFDYKPRDKKKQSEHIVEVRINGDKKLMIVTGNPRMAQALNGQLRFERWHNIFWKWNAAIKNFMASVFTSYSPTFALRNMFRDWTHFRTMLGVREGHGYAQQANKYYRQSLFKMTGLFKKYREGTLDENNEMERDFKDFMDNGGITGFVQMQKIDDIQKQMEKLRKQQKQGKAIRLNDNILEKIFGAVEALNEGIENNARFATYRASRHYANRTKARSAYDAKEITVNFNRKGAGGKTAGYKSQSKMVEDAAKAFGITSQILGEGRIFFNATVQAIATTFKNFQNADGSLNKPYIAKWAAKYALPPFMFGLLLPYINQVLAAALDGGDGDDDPYANLPEWTRRKNICIYIGDNNFITIPIGQELAAFLSLGDMVAGMTYAPDLKPLDRGVDDELVGIMNTFSPVDIDTNITKGGLMEDPISEITGRTFSVLAPLVAVEQNLGWTGRPIYREDVYSSDKNNPEYQMVYSGTNPVMVNASKLMNDLSGGDEVKRGKIQVNPAIVQYLWEQYTGGPGKLFSNTISIGKDAKDILSGEESDFNIRKVEGLKAFVQQGDDRTAYYRTHAKYRRYKQDADALSDEVNGYKQSAAEDPAAYMKLEEISRGEDYVRMEIVKEAEKTLRKINKEANKAEGKRRKELRQLYNQKVAEVVDALDNVGGE